MDTELLLYANNFTNRESALFELLLSLESPTGQLFTT
jgi:hypothetical protein